MAGLEILSDENFRLDGRKPNELRKIRCNMGVFAQADGSAYFEQGNTKVLSTVYGPHEIRGARNKLLHDRAVINCQFSMATFSTVERKQRPRGDRKSIEMTMHLQQIYDVAILTSLYPRSQIDIFIEATASGTAGVDADIVALKDITKIGSWGSKPAEVLQSDGGNFAASVNASTLALIDAGIPVKDFVCACTVGFTAETPLMDINSVEESSSMPEFTVAMLPKSDQIVLLEMNSRVHMDHLSKILDSATKGCKDVYLVLDQAVREHVSRASDLMNR